jgi:hypothetical protein
VDFKSHGQTHPLAVIVEPISERGVDDAFSVIVELQAGTAGRAFDHAGEPALVKGAPRSLTKTKGDDGLSRWRRRSARSSSPWI